MQGVPPGDISRVGRQLRFPKPDSLTYLQQKSVYLLVVIYVLGGLIDAPKLPSNDMGKVENKKTGALKDTQI